MKTLNGYLFRTILGSIFVVLAIILGIDLLAQIIDETGDIRESYTFLEVLVYALFKIPGTLYEMLPFAALIGCLVGLGSLANSSELTVIRAAGVSSGRVVWMVMRPAIALIFLGLLVGEYVAPNLDQMAESRRDLLRGTGAGNTTTSLWLTDDDEYVHIETVFPNGVLFGVTRYAFNNDNELDAISHAFRAQFQDENWLEEGVRLSEITAEQISASSIDQRDWRTLVTPRLLNVLVLEPDQLSLRDLHQYRDSLQTLTSIGERYSLAFWSKALQPLAVAGLVLVAISFIFGSMRQVAMGQRVFVGVLIGVIFQMVQRMLAPASIVYGFSALTAVLVPIIFMFLLGGFMLWRRK